MTLLHEKFTSGNQFMTAGSGQHVGLSGINDITGRINVGGYDFPQSQNWTFTVSGALEITKAVISGTTQYYEINTIYNTDINPTVIEVSGSTIGSIFTHNFYYATGSGTASAGSIVAGSTIIT